MECIIGCTGVIAVREGLDNMEISGQGAVYSWVAFK